MVIEIIIITFLAFVFGWTGGYAYHFRKCLKAIPLERRCECLRQTTEGNRRCQLEAFHTGPHCWIVPRGYLNAGEYIWWENSEFNFNKLLNK